jgi:deoxycytidylate deaminase|tara:strand:+ start:1171 stop:1617 length:447 start_codon:yes stop_codon:yes gene_type:complete
MSRRSKEYDDGPLIERIMSYRGRNSRYFNSARKAALCSEQTDYKHGAVLIKGGSIINTSCNKNRLVSFGSRFCKDHDGVATLHAELGAILGIERNITEGATLYVARVGKDGGFRLSKPCSMCTAAMEYVGIKRAYWTIDNHSCAMGKL